MAGRLRVGRSDDPPPEGTARLTSGALSELNVTPGDTILLEGDDRTVVTVSRGENSEELRIALADRDRRNANVEIGETIRCRSVAAPPAEQVRLRPDESFGVRGGAAAVRRELQGRPVTPGDTVRISVFAGSLAVTFVVEATTPDGPVVIDEETEVTFAEQKLTEGAAPDQEGFDAIGGLDETIAQLRALVAAPLSRPAVADHLGEAVPSGVLLTGASGTGKTLLARALGAEIDAHFLSVSGGDTIDPDAVAREAVAEAPTLVFVDDLDGIAPATAGDDGRAAGAVRLGQLFDRLASRNDIIVLGATSRPDAVDSSVRRGGRFDRELTVEIPNRSGRRDILEVLTRTVPLAADVDLDELADRTHGYVGADLAALLTVAAERALQSPGARTGESDGLRITTDDIAGALEEVGPAGMRGVSVERPNVGYEDVGGLDAAKRELVRAVEWPLRYPELFDRLRSEPPKGLLLAGPPGTGKTLLAKAVASATDANFLAVNGPELLDRYVGESERSVREVFDRARQHAPTVVFFDEVDAIAAARSSDGGTDAVDRVVSQLLTELDGIEPRDDVVVIAATNRPDIVDPALLRPGRLERTVEVSLPDRAAREEIFHIHTRDVPLGEVALDALARSTEGFSGSDIAAVVREASLLAMEEHLRGDASVSADPAALRVEQAHFDQAIAELDPSVSPELRDRWQTGDFDATD